MNQPPPIPGNDERFGHDADATIPIEPVPENPVVPPPVPGTASSGRPPDFAPPTAPGMIYIPHDRNSGNYVMLLGIGSIPMALSGFCSCGITTFLALPMGIVAWFWGSGELKKVRAGQLPRSSEGQFQAGRICGLIGVALSVLMLAWILLNFAIGISSAISNAPTNGP
jgi:hypothetical protein